MNKHQFENLQLGQWVKDTRQQHIPAWRIKKVTTDGRSIRSITAYNENGGTLYCHINDEWLLPHLELDSHSSAE